MVSNFKGFEPAGGTLKRSIVASTSLEQNGEKLAIDNCGRRR